MTKADYHEVVDSIAVLNWVAKQDDINSFYSELIEQSIDRIQNALPAAQLAKAQQRWIEIGKQRD